MRPHTILASLLIALTCSTSALAQAQDYPSRPIRWVVPFLAGTAPDNTVRIVADAMGGILKQAVIVDNKGGVAGNLGAQMVAKAPADGYTWVYSATPMAASMRMYKKPGFDAIKDFTHVGRIAVSDLTVLVHPDSGIKSIKELMERAKKDPGKLSYASGGIGSPAHMGAELMLNMAGANVLHVPYKGASESATAVIGKQVDFALAISSVAMPHITAGRLVPLAVTGPQRNARQPGTPTLAESGWPGVHITSFGGLSVPAATPAPIVKRISEALAKALAMPEVRARLEAQGGTVAPSTPEEYRDALVAEIGLTEKMMKSAKLEAQ
ncbi:Bug family tripartite tricarboxylate transporter substrate binding protein [Limnohabitans radicicola]|uniref:Tripartite tricarboxylate transporter substrate binding protein n=1 Tax=Limnohabitans radicicola TaxID=2771427 RepID=A0A927FGE7_9BURK|nr:tripartite tricarboxylate transporter substrate binding protein [Limnohabitans radicicola]MBD8050939.1 tripartite tricarboxylate transporter substrate binding protein [Limnohabitans radicicola]